MSGRVRGLQVGKGRHNELCGSIINLLLSGPALLKLFVSQAASGNHPKECNGIEEPQGYNSNPACKTIISWFFSKFSRRVGQTRLNGPFLPANRPRKSGVASGFGCGFAALRYT